MSIEPMTAEDLEAHAKDFERAQCNHASHYRRAAARVRGLVAEREEWGKLSGQTIQDAAVGALVRRIREHPMCKEVAASLACGGGPASCHRRSYHLNEPSLYAALGHLDSLLPKEPEVAPSGWTYERMTGGNGKPWVGIRDDHGDKVAEVPTQNAIEVPPCDRAFVAALLARQEGKGNE